MAMLKPPATEPKTTTLTVRIHEELKDRLDHYAEYLGAGPGYVVSEALRLVFKKDRQFKEWAQHRANGAQSDVSKNP